MRNFLKIDAVKGIHFTHSLNVVRSKTEHDTRVLDTILKRNVLKF
jgi:hypothetical protein